MDKPITLAQIADALLEASNCHAFKKDHPFRQIDSSDMHPVVKEDGSVEIVLYQMADVFGPGKDPKPGTVYQRVYKVRMVLEVEENKIDDD